MDLFEYQAKELFGEYGVPVPQGSIARTPEEARAIAEKFAAAGTPRVVVKAQVKTGGRGKAGGVKLAEAPDEAQARAAEILGMDIKGHRVNAVLVEEASDIAREFYLSFLVDRAARTFTSICSVQGGMEIEEVARTSPAAVAQVMVDPLTGVDGAKAAEIVSAGGLPAEAAAGAAAAAERLWAVFTDEDATLVEVNPLILTGDGRVVALDGKVTLDDNAAYRQDHARFADPGSADPLEAKAKAKHLNYVKLDGEVGIIGNGSDPGVRSVLVNVFGGITSCDEVANGIVSALGMLNARGEQVTRPIVVRLDGNNAAAGRAILDAAGLSVVEQNDTMDGAARRAAELAASPAAGENPTGA